MKTALPLSRRWLRRVAFICCWLASLAGLHAQSGTGTVQGRVFNPISKEYVRNAEVRLDGTPQVTYTENDGSFAFRGVPAGQAAITVTYTGYNTVKETFTVSAGQTVVREITLTSTAATEGGKDVVQLQAFTVSTEREGNAKAIMEQRRNMDITTSVSSDIFGDVTDGNVGEFLKYLPGVDLDYVESEARGPRLGGMDAQYVGVSFDGMRTASADANRGGEASRATSFEGFAITSIESIEISRTTSAESDADSPAGTINMKTKRAFDRKGRRIGYNTSINFNAEEFTLERTAGPRDSFDYKWKPNYSLDYSESFLNQRFGILLSASHAHSFTEQYDVENGYNRTPITTTGAANYDPRPLVIRQINFKDGPKFITKDSYLMTLDWKVTPRLVFSLNAQYTYTEGQFWNRNFTFVAANDNNNANNGRSRVGGDGVNTVIATRATSGSVNNVATLNNGGGSSSKLTYTRTISPRFEYRLNSWVLDGGFNYSRSVNNYESLERGFSNSEGGGAASSWIATRPHDDSWEWTIRQTSGNDWFDLRSFTNTNTRDGGTRVNNDDRTHITELLAGQLNATWSVPFLERFPTRLKFGGKWTEENRDHNNRSAWNVWSYIGPGGNTVRVNPISGHYENATTGNWANVGPQYVSIHPFDLGTTNALTVFNLAGAQGMPPRPSRLHISNLFHDQPDLFVHTGTPNDYYQVFYANKRDFKQTVYAGYTQADVRATAKLQFRFGVRVEETQNAFREFDPLSRADVIAAGYPVYAPNSNGGRPSTFEGVDYMFNSQPRVTRGNSYRNYFPSALAKYKIMPNLEFQAGFNKAISRPPIDNLTGVWNLDEVNERITVPNSELMPEYSKNYQARLAYYLSGRSPGAISVAVSQNDIKNLREQFDFSASEFGVDDPDYAPYTFRTQRNSLEVRRFRNLELDYNQTLGFLPSEYLRGINFRATYTRSYASQRRPNLAPHRFTSRLGYAFRRFNGSIGMVYRDASPDTGTYGRIKGELTQFDLSLTYKLTRWASLYAQGRNITGRPVLWYDSPPGAPEGEQLHLRRMQEYGANWVFGVRGTF